MNLHYDYVVDGSVVQLFTGATRLEREELLRVFDSLAKNPFALGDHQQRTAAGRTVQVKRFGKWLVTYWSDHAVSELRILGVEKLVR